MKAKSLKEWVEFYEKKTKDRFTIPDGFRLYWLPERGFAVMKPDIEGKMLILWEICGDGKFWRDTGELFVANAMGLECVVGVFIRPIRPYLKVFNWEILDEQCINGQERFLCQDSAGRAVVITYKENGNEISPTPSYWVTHYLKRKAAASFDEFFKQKEGN